MTLLSIALNGKESITVFFFFNSTLTKLNQLEKKSNEGKKNQFLKFSR